MKKTLAFAGSNSQHSINQQLIDYTATLKEGIDVIDLKKYDVPIYNPDDQNESGIPERIKQLYKLLQGYDKIIMASPEHNGMPPAFLKNILDWLSVAEGEKFLKDKNVALISTSPGGFGGSNNLKHLKTVMPYWGANIVGTYSLGNFYENMDTKTNILKSEEEKEQLLSLLDQL